MNLISFVAQMALFSGVGFHMALETLPGSRVQLSLFSLQITFALISFRNTTVRHPVTSSLIDTTRHVWFQEKPWIVFPTGKLMISGRLKLIDD